MNENVLGLKLAYSPASFFQVNTPAADLLYEKAIEELAPNSEDAVVDLFCGVGALTLLAAQKAKFAVGIEWASSSVRDAQFNANTNRIRNVKFVQADAGRYLSSVEGLELKEIPQDKLLIMVDPPRSGCAPELIQNLLKLKPKRIVYISCNPATLARDVKLLSPFYRVSSVTPVDLFPQTSHIESVTRLDFALS